MIIYVYSKCSTCQNALRFLEKIKSKGSFTIKEITSEPPSVPELETMLKYYEGNIKRLLNTSGMLYREMKIAEKMTKMSQSDVLSLLSHHGMLVKRPFLIAKDFGLTGFKESEWEKKFEEIAMISSEGEKSCATRSMLKFF